MKFVNDLYTALNKDNVTIAVYIDLRKAFDMVNHVILSKKLENCGVKNLNMKWIKSYLDKRSQSVTVNGMTLNARPIVCGVPQGSVLRPLLFLIYVNDMSQSLIHSHYQLYADNTVKKNSGKNLQEIVPNLQSDLNNYSEWCNANCLSLNVKKTKFVIYGTKNRVRKVNNAALYLGGNQIYCEPSYNYLGIVLDSNLSFKKHIDHCAKVVVHKIYILSKIRRTISEDIQLFSFIVP